MLVQRQKKGLRVSGALFFVPVLLFSALLPASLILPAFLGLEMASFDQQRWLQLGAMTLILAVAGYHRAYWRYWVFSSGISNGLWVGVLSSGLVAVALSPRPLTSLTEGLYFLGLFALIQAGRFFRARQPGRFDGALQSGLYLSAGFYALMLLVGLVVAARYPDTTHEYLIVSFNNIRFFGDYALLQLLLVFAGCRADDHWNRNVLVVLAGIFWLALLLMGGRAVLVAWAAALVTVFIVRRRAASRFIADQLVAVLIALLALWLVDSMALFPETGLSRDWTTDSGRLELWSLAARSWIEHPWFGAGPMMLAAAGDGNTAAHTHNLLLQWLAEWGLVPTLFLLVLLARAAIRVLVESGSQPGRHDPEADAWNLPALTALLTVAALAMVDGVLYGVPAAQLFVVAAVVLWSRSSDQVTDQGSVGPEQRQGSWLGGVVTLVVIAALSLGAWHVRESGLECLEHGHGVIERPRLWYANRLCGPDFDAW
jgi:O-antigen ligase